MVCSATEGSSSRSDLEKAFLHAVNPLREKLRRCYDDELATLGISRSLATALMCVSQSGGIRQRELAEFLEVEGPSVVRLLDQLERDGLVSRTTDPADQRAKTLHLTEAGENLVLRISPILQQLRTRLLGDVSSTDLQACLRTFAHILGECEHRAATVTK